MRSYLDLLALGFSLEPNGVTERAGRTLRVLTPSTGLRLRAPKDTDPTPAREAVAQRIPIVRALLAKETERIPTPRWGVCEVCGLGMESFRGGWCPLCKAALQKIRETESKETPR
jgi:hypothetical protein